MARWDTLGPVGCALPCADALWVLSRGRLDPGSGRGRLPARAGARGCTSPRSVVLGELRVGGARLPGPALTSNRQPGWVPRSGAQASPWRCARPAPPQRRLSLRIDGSSRQPRACPDAGRAARPPDRSVAADSAIVGAAVGLDFPAVNHGVVSLTTVSSWVAARGPAAEMAVREYLGVHGPLGPGPARVPDLDR